MVSGKSAEQPVKPWMAPRVGGYTGGVDATSSPPKGSGGVVRIRSNWTNGPCEFSAGVNTMMPAPSVTLCGKPGKARKGVMWCEIYACDECYSRWLNHPSRARTRDHSEEVKPSE